MSLIAETSMVTGLADVFCCFQIKYCETLSPDSELHPVKRTMK